MLTLETEVREVPWPDRLARHWLDGDLRPRLAIDGDREVLWANAAARRLLRAPLPICLKRKRLGFDDAIEAAAGRFLDQAASSLTRMPIPLAAGQGVAVLGAWADEVEDRRVVFVEVVLPHVNPGARHSGVAQRFGLTPAECRVFDALVRIEPPAAIARRLGVSIHTVRTHIRRIYGKLEVRSQPELVRLALAMGGG